MGLDISVKKLFPAPEGTSEDDLSAIYSDFPRSLTPEEKFSFNCEDDLNDESFDSLYVGYSYYNRWREWLCLIAFGRPIQALWDECQNIDPDSPYPNGLYHLLNFADNEGYIGPTAAKSIHVAIQDINPVEGDPHHLETLDEWKRVIKVAAENDAYIHFH